MFSDYPSDWLFKNVKNILSTEKKSKNEFGYMDIEIKGIVFTPLCRTLRWKKNSKKLEESKSPIPCDIQYCIIRQIRPISSQIQSGQPKKVKLGGWKNENWTASFNMLRDPSTDMWMKIQKRRNRTIQKVKTGRSFRIYFTRSVHFDSFTLNFIEQCKTRKTRKNTSV